jgi:hypothetical protein
VADGVGRAFIGRRRSPAPARVMPPTDRTQRHLARPALFIHHAADTAFAAPFTHHPQVVEVRGPGLMPAGRSRCDYPPAARMMLRTCRRVAGGRSGHLAATSARSGSIAGFSGPGAPPDAPPPIRDSLSPWRASGCRLPCIDLQSLWRPAGSPRERQVRHLHPLLVTACRPTVGGSRVHRGARSAPTADRANRRRRPDGSGCSSASSTWFKTSTADGTSPAKRAPSS